MSNDIRLVSFETREDWLRARQGGIGGSESAALFGISPWISRFGLWAEKTGLVDPVELTGEWLKWGQLLEEPIATNYQEVTGRSLWKPPSPYAVAVHPRLPFMFATLDRWVIAAPDRPDDGRGDLQIKNASWFKGDDWRDGVPDFIQAQVQHELAVTGLGWGSVAVLIGGNRFAHFDIERNDAYIAELEAQCEHFWDMVQRKERPPTDGSEMTTQALKRLHPLDNGTTIALGAEVGEAWDELSALKAATKANEARQAELSNLIKAAIGDASFAQLPDGRQLSFKHASNPGFTTVVQPFTFRTLREVKQPSTNARKRAKAA